MKQEDKELLLKDLCARLPYGVKCKLIYDNKAIKDEDATLFGIDKYGNFLFAEFGEDTREFVCKPYLFPLSAMMEEQKEELFYNYIHNDIYFDDFTDYFLAGELWHDICVSMDKVPALINWLLKNHFDIYGLIPKGLAKDATGLNIY